jgi:small-conductance mechanosensitive channel
VLPLKDFLETKLLTISGTTLTVGSLLAGAATVFFTVALANVLAFSARRLLKHRDATPGAQFAMAKIVRYATLVIGLVTAVNAMGFQLGALLAASAVLAVGIGFGLQNIAQNFISGIILLIEQPVRHGDFVRVGDTLGTVEDIGLRATHIITRDEVTIIVPNSALITEKVINHSRPTTNLRIRVPIGIAYESDTDQVKAVLLRVAKEMPGVLGTPPPEVRLEEFGESALTITLYCWIGHARDDLRTASALRFAIHRAFVAEGIEIPYPQREIRERPSRISGRGVA